MHGFLCGNASPHYSTLLRVLRPPVTLRHPADVILLSREPSRVPLPSSTLFQSSRSASTDFHRGKERSNQFKGLLWSIDLPLGSIESLTTRVNYRQDSDKKLSRWWIFGFIEPTIGKRTRNRSMRSIRSTHGNFTYFAIVWKPFFKFNRIHINLVGRFS